MILGEWVGNLILTPSEHLVHVLALRFDEMLIMSVCTRPTP